MATERTLVLVKPDGVERGLIGEIISRFERRCLKIAGLKMLKFDEALVKTHYAEHVEKPFFPDLKEFVMRGPVVALVVEGEDAIELVRTMMGKTKYTDAAPGTIRGDYAYSFTENLIHGSDSAESAARELALYFNDNELY